MIDIILDTENYNLKICDTHVHNFYDYCRYYKLINDCVINDKNLSLITHDLIIFRWLKNLACRFSEDLFNFEVYQPIHELARRLDIVIPSYVTNESIIQSELLSLNLQSSPGKSFEDIILSHFYSPIFCSNFFPNSKISELFQTYDTQRFKSNHQIPLVNNIYYKRIEEWKNKAHSNNQRQLIGLFEKDPFKLKKILMSFRVLQNYPVIGEALLGDKFDLFKNLKLPLEDLAIDEKEIQEVVLQVTYQLNKQQPQSADELTELIETVSGLLAIEFDTVEKLLYGHSNWISLSLIETFENKFSGTGGRYSRRIAQLRNMIPPPKPSYPELFWKAEKMLQWATESYLPFQTWCNQKGQFDPEVYKIGDRFSEWLIQNWTDIHANSKRFVFNILPNKAVEFKQPGRVNLVLVIDNLAWSFNQLLTNLFQEKGFYLSTAEPYLSMVPSETETSKKCLLAGAVGYQAIDDKNYKGIIEKGWVPYFNDIAFQYVSDIGSLRKIEHIDAATYVVNYLAIDKALHKPADEIGMSHLQHIEHLLNILVENVTNFVEKHDLQDRIRIHIISDHGSTRIPNLISNDIDPTSYKIGFNTISHRYISVPNELFANLAENLKMDCFFLPANDFLNQENFLVARRGNRFITTDKDVYFHGGLLPEEVIVPYLLFEPALTSVENLTVLLMQNIFRYRMEIIDLEIGNPNDFAVEQIQVNVLNRNVESEPIRIAMLNRKTNEPVKIQARFKITNNMEDQMNLHLLIRFIARGESYHFELTPSIQMRRMVEQKNSGIFDD